MGSERVAGRTADGGHLFLTAVAAAAVMLIALPAGAAPREYRTRDASRQAQAYGLFLSGQAALDAGDNAAAAGYFAAARQLAPDTPMLGEQAFTAALLSGDIERAAALAPRDPASPSARALVTLVKAVDALAEGRGREAYAVLRADLSEKGADQAAILLRPWAAAAAGRTEESVALPQTRDRVFNLVAALSQAQLLERARRYEAAETTYKAGLAQSSGRMLLGPAFGLFLERRGRAAEAVQLYSDLLAENPGDVTLQLARTRAEAKGKAPAMPSITEGAAQTLMAPAAAMLSSRMYDSGLIYLRLILRLEPGREDAWLMLGELMLQAGDREAAREALARIRPGSPRYVLARTRAAWSYQADAPQEALKIARQTALEAPDDPNAQLSLADLLRAQEQFTESAAVMDAVIARDEARADWKFYYLRGSALERAGRWAEAERDMLKALSMRPDEPEVLNYLGYAWVDRGVKVKEGLAMIEKALAAEPGNGAFIDSLGWAHYRLGDYRLAVEKLEQAVQLAPGDAEINDHLGDAYWKAGRRDEARFKWRAVLTLEPDAAIKARAERKLASPMGPDARVVASSPAEK